MSKHGNLFTAIFIAIAIAAVVAIATASASAQSMTGSNDSGSLPVSLFIDHVISAHEQDIKDRMLDYEFNHTTSEAVKASIIKERGDELNAAALDSQAFLKVLNNDSNRGLIPGDRLDAMLNVTKDSIERLSISSNKLQEKAQKLNGHVSSGTADPLIKNINNASSMADNIFMRSNNKGNAGIAVINQLPKQPGNQKRNK